MAKKRPLSPSGTVVVLEHSSRILADNPLGDPHVRKLAVWLPAAVRRSRGEDAGAGDSRCSTTWWASPDRGSRTSAGSRSATTCPSASRASFTGSSMGPTIIVFPDCFTSLGGNQYVNSSAIGRYADYLTREIIPFVDREFRTLATREHRGCFGKSSGRLRRDHPRDEICAALGRDRRPLRRCLLRLRLRPRLAEHAERARQVPRADAQGRALRLSRATSRARQGLAEGQDDGRVKRFLDAVWRKEKLSPAEGHAIMNVCMAATYDPDPAAPLGFRLPFHLETGERLEARWKNWRRHDPIHLVATHRRSLESLRGIYIDCGWRDQYHIHYGTRILSRRLAEAGIRHTYEEYDDNHSDVDYRMDVSLPFLYRALKP